MKPILFESTETEFRSNGLGRLDPVKCTVTEERNGRYELEMTVSINDRHYAEIQEGRLVLARHDDTGDLQPFEIYRISRPISGRETVFAHHISYRTAGITVMPFSATSAVEIFERIPQHTTEPCPFTFWTDKLVPVDYTTTVPTTLRELLGGTEGSILDAVGKGEYEWDRFTIKLHLNRGHESNLTLRYGRDITDLEKMTDTSGMWTGVAPFWQGTDEDGEDAVVVLPEEVIKARESELPIIVPLDLSSSFEEMPTVEELRAMAVQYVEENADSEIPSTIEVSFIEEDSTRLASLRWLSLCDTLTITYKRLGVENKAKIVKTVYNVLEERYRYGRSQIVPALSPAEGKIASEKV